MKTKLFFLIAVLLAFVGLDRSIAQTPDSSVIIWSQDVPEGCYAVQVSPDGLTCANSAGQFIQIRNMSDGSLIRQFGEHDNERVNSIRYSPDGRYLFTGAGEYHWVPVSVPYIKMWDVNTGELIRQFDTDDSTYYTYIRSMDVSIEGNQVAAVVFATNDIKVFIWDVITGLIINKIEFANDDKPNHLKYSPTGEFLIIDNEEDVVLYSYPGIEFVSRLGNAFVWHESRIKAIAVTSDGKKVASIDDANIVKLWDIYTRDLVKTLNFKKISQPTQIQFDKTNNYVLSMTSIPQVLKLSTGNLINPYNQYNPEFLGIDLDITNENNLCIAGVLTVKLIQGIYEPIGVEEPVIIITDDTLYPNPTNNLINIEFTLSNNENVMIELLNLNGQIIEIIKNNYFPTGLNTIQYDCSVLANGVYYIKVSSSNFTKTYKLIKEG